MDNSSGEEYEPAIVFESQDLSVCKELMCLDVLVLPTR